MSERAPGCFGYATTFNEKSDTCINCVFRRHCQIAAFKQLKAVHEDMDVSALMARFKKQLKNATAPVSLGVKKGDQKDKVKAYSVTTADAALMMKLPNQPRRVARQLIHKGIDIGFMLRSGINPFNDAKPAFMVVPCDLLLQSGEFTRQSLKQALLKRFDHWSEGTAESHASIVCTLLPALNVVKKTDDKYTFNRG